MRNALLTTAILICLATASIAADQKKDTQPQCKQTQQTQADRHDSSVGFEELALFDSLYNFAHWFTQNREEAEDLVQETYTKALKGFGSFQPGTNFRAWIFRIRATHS
jgi:DNA-directed RNA polymerase specialized sigma24 family protein